MTLSPGTHGVVIVHGIGNPAAGDTIAAFTKAVCDILINSPEGSLKPQVQLKSDVSAKIPTVTLHITSSFGEHAAWLCREAHWGDAFPPPTPTQVLWWGVNQTSYWDNKELVMPRFLRAINAGAEYPWPAAGITKEKVAARIRKAFNYVSLSEIIWCLVMLAIVVLLVLILTGIIRL